MGLSYLQTVDVHSFCHPRRKREPLSLGLAWFVCISIGTGISATSCFCRVESPSGALRRVVLLFLFVFCLLPAIFLRGSTVAACSLAENSKGAGIKRGVVLSWVVSGSCGVEVCCVVHRLCSSCSVLPAQKLGDLPRSKCPHRKSEGSGGSKS